MRALYVFTFICFFFLSVEAQEHPLPVQSPFERIKVSGNIHLQLIATGTPRILVDEESVPDKLDIEWSDHILILKTRSELNNNPAIRVKLEYASLTGLEISRGAVVQSADTLKTKILTLNVETGGKAEIFVVADSLSARVNQGSDIILRGSARSQLINANTLGNYLGYELAADNTWVKAATGAQVKVNSSKLLNANANSKAFVGYRGNPEHKILKNSTGGEITQQNQ
jgi:hypothetical protein